MSKKLFMLIFLIISILSLQNISFANELNPDLFMVKGEQMEKLFSEIETVNNINKDSVNDIEFILNATDEEDKLSIFMNGSFDIKGINSHVEAEGVANKYYTSEYGDFYLGYLNGLIYINNKERKISVSYEKSNNGTYYAITINKLTDEEGFAVVTFGESVLDKKLLIELGIFKESDFEPKSDIKNYNEDDYDKIDYDWSYLEDYDDPDEHYNVLKSSLYLSKNITEKNSDSGKILTKVQIRKNAVKKVLENETDFKVLTSRVEKFVVDFDSVDERVAFLSHSPTDDDDDDDVFSFIKSALWDLGVPSTVIEILEQCKDDLGSSISVRYENDSNRRVFKIRPHSDRFMDHSENHYGGYPIVLTINNANMVADEGEKRKKNRIDVDIEMSIISYTNEHNRHISLETEWGDLDLDLMDY